MVYCEQQHSTLVAAVVALQALCSGTTRWLFRPEHLHVLYKSPSQLCTSSRHSTATSTHKYDHCGIDF
eukprot:scaffold8021_cov79-Skeletonema_marinoi.AAC.7